MSGRGRPRKAQSPETKSAGSKTTAKEFKHVSLPESPQKEEKLSDTTEERKPKKREPKEVNHTEKKTFAQTAQRGKTTHYLTETPSAKLCAGRAKSPEETREEMRRQKIPKETTKTSMKVKACTEREISPQQSSDVGLETAMDKKTKSIKAAKVKACGVRAESPELLATEETKKLLKTPEDTIKAKVQGRKAKLVDGKMQQKIPEDHPEADTTDKADMNTILLTTLEKLKIKMNDKSEASQVINRIIKQIVEHLKNNTCCFTEVQEPLRTGSYYENLKISNPDEFDVMLPFPVERVDIKPFGDDGAFYSVTLPRGKNPLKKFQPESNPLSANEMLKEFREEVKKSIKNFPDIWRVSFSHVEKAILKNHGSEKTCCEKDGDRCCRKDCLKLLKHLLSLLKSENSSYDKFCSYHAKTTFLHACCSRTKDSEWAFTNLSQCFQLLLKDFESHLERGQLNNFFIPTQNLLSGPGQRSCKSLALRIREEREKGFPIFTKIH
ncbi:cyclic GMP-AMP synthase isoform X2 [Sphaeramia orbicularis]|uniref:cyclic GMP-AMP synthase isoform X2 n=1 Tax=Sphaeramia orbicularis TaxID=375764 RepID=UPI00117EB47E|nr:cyclic GMP-AMP synthase-like isoform X2 [Sphaeramia orbicularis]